METNSKATLVIAKNRDTEATRVHVFGHMTRECFPENSLVEVKDITNADDLAKALTMFLKTASSEYRKPCQTCWSSVIHAISLGKREERESNS